MIPKDLAYSYLKDLKRDVKIVVYKSRDMLKFAEELKNLSDKISIEFHDYVEPKLNIPAISVRNVFFHFIPIHELELFLQTIKYINLKHRYDYKCDVLTFVSRFCPNCKITVDSINRIAMESKIEHHIVDVSENSEFIDKFNIVSVPTTIINDFRITGAINVDEARKWIELSVSKDYSEYFVDRLTKGELDVVKEVVLANPKLSKVLAELIAHRDFIVRLGAMAALEYLQKIYPHATKFAKDVVISLLNHDDSRIRQDAAMMLGIIGDSEDIPLLKKFESDEDIGDAVKESIKAIRRREDG